jgi:hypothetical protein
VSTAAEAMAALAHDLVEEIAAGRVIELAGGMAAAAASPVAVKQPPPPPMPPQTGAAAVHPLLGSHLARLPGDTISCHAYKHLQPQQAPVLPPGAAGPIASG